MTLHYEDATVQIHHDDCLDVLRALPDASVDAVVTDPPYGLEFMGKEWDGADGFRRSLNANDAGRDNPFGRTSRTSPEYRAGTLFQQWCELWTAECLRVLRPGGHLVAKADASERVRVNGTAHPTVKPLALMRWLVRLVTPPGGKVLDPFGGSGTTVEACILEGFQCIAIEREADYLPLIVQRINRRRDPVAAVLAQGDDMGLFDLLDGEGA